MKSTKNYLPVEEFYPVQGLETKAPSTQLNPKYTPNCLNMVFSDGVARARPGCSVLGTNTLSGTVMSIIPFRQPDGSTKTVVVTTRKQYQWSNGNWENITIQSAGTDVDFTGTEDDRIDWAVGTDDFGTWLFVTNGKDAPIRWDGSGRFEAHGFNVPGFTTCKCLQVYKQALLVGNVNTNEPKTVYWSDTSNFTNFLSGTADVDILTDADGPLVKMLPIGEQLAVYSQNSIHVVSYVGGDLVFTVVKVLEKTRLLGPDAIASFGPVHFFMSQENVILFDGTRQTRAFADKIKPTYTRTVNLDIAKRAHAFFDAAENTFHFYLPTRSALVQGVDLTMEIDEVDFYNPEACRWSILNYALAPSVTSFGTFIRDQIVRWVDVGGTWANQITTWLDKGLKLGFPLLILGAGSNVFIFDAKSFNDNGNALTRFYHTMDFTVPREYVSELGRWIEVEIEMTGASVEVLYSLDQGATFNKFAGGDSGYVNGVQTLTSQFKRYRFYLDVVSRYFRLVFQSNQYFEFRFYKIQVTPAGAW